MAQNQTLEDLLIGLASIFLATCAAYWCSDFWIDFKYVTGTYGKILLTLVGFLLVPFIFWLLDNEFQKAVTNRGANIKSIIVVFSLVVVITLAQLITGKIK